MMRGRGEVKEKRKCGDEDEEGCEERRKQKARKGSE